MYGLFVIDAEVSMSKGLTSETPMNKGFQRSFFELACICRDVSMR
jgi:hypothetical protein